MTQFLSSLAIATMLVAGAGAASPASANDVAIETMTLQNEGFRSDPARNGPRTRTGAGIPPAMAAPAAGNPSARKSDNEWRYVPVRRFMTVKP